MAMKDAGAVLAQFDIADGELRGTHLSLHAACVVHRGDHYLETLPLATLASVRVAFDRNERRLGWGGGLVVVALLVFGIAGPLGALAGSAGADMSAQQAGGGTGVAAALLGLFHFVEGLARVLPFLAAAVALGGAALCALGWIGATTLTLTFAGGQRDYSVRGRSSLLLDFSERVSEQLVVLKR